MEIALDVNDAGRLALGGSMGPEIGQIEGRLVQRETDGYLVGVKSIHFLRGGDQTWTGEQVRLKSEYVSSVYIRKFSASRTALAAAAGAGAIVAILAARGVIGSGSVDQPQSGGDTSATVRRPLPGRVHP